QLNFDLSAIELPKVSLAGSGPMITFAATTLAGLALLFLLTRPRPRREPEPPPSPAGPETSPSDGTPARVTTFVNPVARPRTLPEEEGIPRWLRPSVRRGRGGDVEVRRMDWD